MDRNSAQRSMKQIAPPNNMLDFHAACTAERLTIQSAKISQPVATTSTSKQQLLQNSLSTLQMAAIPTSHFPDWFHFSFFLFKPQNKVFQAFDHKFFPAIISEHGQQLSFDSKRINEQMNAITITKLVSLTFQCSAASTSA